MKSKAFFKEFIYLFTYLFIFKWRAKAPSVLRLNPQQLDGSVVIYLFLFDSTKVRSAEEEPERRGKENQMT